MMNLVPPLSTASAFRYASVFSFVMGPLSSPCFRIVSGP